MSRLDELVSRANVFRAEAHRILSQHESSPSRIVLLTDSYELLESFNIRQDDLFRQSLRCTENGLYRAAHVMAWAALISYIEELLGSATAFAKLRALRTKWAWRTIDEVRENVPEYQILEAFRDVGFCSKSECKALIGLLNKRNECAHPSEYLPGLNETLGYIAEILGRVDTLQTRILK